MEFNLEQIDTLLSTTRAVRRRLDFTREVPDEVPARPAVKVAKASTMSPRPSPCGCRSTRRRSPRSRRGASRRGLAASPPARSASR